MTNKKLEYAKYLIGNKDVNNDEIYNEIKKLSKCKNDEKDKLDYRTYLIIGKLYMKVKEYELAKYNFLSSYLLSENNNVFKYFYMISIYEGDLNKALYYLEKIDVDSDEKILNKYLINNIVNPDSILESFEYDNLKIVSNNDIENNKIIRYLKEKKYKKLRNLFDEIKGNDYCNIKLITPIICLLNRIINNLPNDKELAILLDKSIEGGDYHTSSTCLNMIIENGNQEYEKFVEIEKSKISEMLEISNLRNSEKRYNEFEKIRNLIKNKEYDTARINIKNSIEIDGLNIYNYYLGKIYFKEKNFSLAKEYLEKYMLIGGTKYEKSLLYLAIIYKNENNMKKFKKSVIKLEYINKILEKEEYTEIVTYNEKKEDYYDSKPKRLLKSIIMTEDDFKS